eukprot:scaffold143_cov173-Ochromonas_danica.AAC.12
MPIAEQAIRIWNCVFFLLPLRLCWLADCADERQLRLISRRDFSHIFLVWQTRQSCDGDGQDQ